MKVTNRDNKAIIVLSPNGSGCPRLVITENKLKFADDYKGSVKINKKILSQIIEL